MDHFVGVAPWRRWLAAKLAFRIESLLSHKTRHAWVGIVEMDVRPPGVRQATKERVLEAECEGLGQDMLDRARGDLGWN